MPAGALLPEQLQLRDAGGLLRAAPHEEEVAEGEDPRPAAAAALEAERPVEDVGAVRAARGADPLVLKLLTKGCSQGGEGRRRPACRGSVSGRNAAPTAARRGLQRRRDRDQTEQRFA